jgi:hypothetical protein
MEVPRQDLRLIRDALIVAEAAVCSREIHGSRLQIERALTHANWLLAAYEALIRHGHLQNL